MAKTRTQFICRSCGGVQARWMGKCPDCAEWDSLEEYRAPAGGGADKDRQRGDAPVATASDVVPQAVPINEARISAWVRRENHRRTRWVINPATISLPATMAAARPAIPKARVSP